MGRHHAHGALGAEREGWLPLTIELEVFAFLTTTPNPLVATINHERMPVVLTRAEEFETWLRGSPEEAWALAKEYPPEEMRIVREGFFKEDRRDIAA